MMKFTILISFQLFYILLFSKTFVRAKDIEVKVHIQWKDLPRMKDLEKLAFEWNWTQRFELKLFRLSYDVNPFGGRKKDEQPIVAITGHYDFATLKVPLEKIGTQNAMVKGKEVAESSNRKRKQMENMVIDNTENKDLYELEIKVNPPPENRNIKQVNYFNVYFNYHFSHFLIYVLNSIFH